MNLTKFLAPAVACCVLVTGATGFDTLLAENHFPDRDIIISPGFGRVTAEGEAHSFSDSGKLEQLTNNTNTICPYNPLKKSGIPHDHRLTLTEKADLQFIVKANKKDPVLFIYSEDKNCGIQFSWGKQEHFNSIKLWKDMPAGTYLIWVGDYLGKANNDQYNYNEYQLEIEEEQE